MQLQRLTLTDFRNYAALNWHPRSRIAVLFGPNGSGKTNLLEAVSLLVPGRGLRGARNADLKRHGAPDGWAVAARIATAQGETDIGTGTSGIHGIDGRQTATDRRVFRLDGAAPRSQAEIAARIAAIWLVPQMDRLFLDGPQGRRRFLDRLVWTLEPSHAREIAAYETAMGSRNRLLAEGQHDLPWLAGLEDEMARHAIAATAARVALAERLNAALTGGAVGDFPAARIALVCPIADRLAAEPAVAVEEWLRAGLATSRARDAAAGTAVLGIHRADMALTDAATGTRAALASTGEQKALLLGVILGHAVVIAGVRGFSPLLLLDEPAVHLDPGRRLALFSALTASPAQIMITGTDAETFLPLMDVAEGLQTGGGTLCPDIRFLASRTTVPPVLSGT